MSLWGLRHPAGSMRTEKEAATGLNDLRAARFECIFNIAGHPRGEKRYTPGANSNISRNYLARDLPKNLYGRHSNTRRVTFYLKFDLKDIVSVGQITTHFCMTTDVFPGISTPHMHALPPFQAS